ncbi:MAG: hypothetical protein FRX48_08181 [Lasallia pustulata]|uniref:Uncharacterized protein n=1 Tax=Lasallia pustulata TaxID=136370 RepID=A0A5M8PG08_9LECA|nr:MAG: hypothetical protein FRX48_08181 [Lasallia pustulata]
MTKEEQREDNSIVDLILRDKDYTNDLKNLYKPPRSSLSLDRHLRTIIITSTQPHITVTMCEQEILEYACGHTKRYEFIRCAKKDCQKTKVFYTELRRRCSLCRPGDELSKGNDSKDKGRYYYYSG